MENFNGHFLQARLRAEAAALLRPLHGDTPTDREAFVLTGIGGALILINVVLRALDESSELARLLLFELDLSEEEALVDHYRHALSFPTSGLFSFDYIARNTRISMFLSSLYQFVWFDDAAMYHERFGSVLVDLMSLPAMALLRAQDAGEIRARALAGAVFAALLPWVWQRRGTGDLGLVVFVAATFAALLIVGIAFDMVHVMLGNRL